MTNFVNLRAYSDYSIGESIAAVKKLVEKAASLNIKHLALTDKNLSGLPEFQAACLARSIHPILGGEFKFSLCPVSALEDMDDYIPLTLLAESEEGYFNLIKLSSIAHLKGEGFIDEKMLASRGKGLIAIADCNFVPAHDAEIDETAGDWLQQMKRIMGENNFFISIYPVSSDALSLKKNELDLLSRFDIPIVATSIVKYIEKEDKEALYVYKVISDIMETINIPDSDIDFHFRHPSEIESIFADFPQAVDNTALIAERCTALIPHVAPQIPQIELPVGLVSAKYYLRMLAMEGLEKLYGGLESYDKAKERTEYELGIIEQTNSVDYFLVVADYVNWAKNNDILVSPGRGAGSSSIVAYETGITGIDPLEYGLLFERFITPDKENTIPDFDVDFSAGGLEKVINYVTEKYGRNRVGQIVTFGTIHWARPVIKEVASVLDFNVDEINMIVDLISDDTFRMSLNSIIEQEPRLRELEQDPKFRKIFTIAQKLEGLIRVKSIHAAGLVIGKTNLADYVPLYRNIKTGVITSQYAWNHFESCGLIKFDFLRLEILDIIGNTGKEIRKRGGEYADFTIGSIPMSDPKTFELLGEGDTEGVFQFESQGMQEILKSAQPLCVADLIALNALYRPGPMEYIPLFIARKQGREPVEYPDPCLEDILKETYGIIVYQEQVMLIAQKIAGYSPGKADTLLRSMLKRKTDIIEKERKMFSKGAAINGFSANDAGRIFDVLIAANWSFNKGHAAANALIAYQCAYLKANFRKEFEGAI